MIAALQWMWGQIIADFYFYGFFAFVFLVAAEETLAGGRKWRNKDDQIAYGQREENPADKWKGL